MMLTRDDRDDLTAAALLSERRNRPMGLTVLGALLSAIALIALVVAMFSVLGAGRERARQLDILRSTQELAGEYRALSLAEQTRGDDPFAQDFAIKSTIENAAVRAGLSKPALPRELPTGQGAIKQVLLPYTVRDNDIAKILSWVRDVQDLPGVGVSKLRIAPQGNQWVVDVTFSRWERRA